MCMYNRGAVLMVINNFVVYLKTRNTVNAVKCLKYMQKVHASLVLEKAEDNKIFFFVDNQSNGLDIPKYLVTEVENFLKSTNTQGSVHQNAQIYIVEFQDTHERDCMSTYYYNMYEHYVIRYGYKPIKKVDCLKDTNKIAHLLYEADKASKR